MSNEVDQRVVEMQFNNAKFEKNVQQSIDSLHALNESLKFEGAEKGFAEVERASEKVDFSRMESALESLNSRFSALEVMGTTALVKITSQAIDAGEKLAKSLSIDQVTAGWSKYAQKTASVQTIMNATGKSIGKVNSYLDKLMWYSDETSYGFTDMTASLGQLTAAGGDIEKLIPMIMGIANATAYAGKGASEFSRVIYNLNQSYSQGYLSLMDWKSVELAGVATAELKQQIISVGEELGKIKKGEVTIGTFGSTLSKKWADKEVMETAFGRLAEFTEAVKDAMEANPKKYPTAAKAIEDLADQYDEVTVKAFKAAQEAKSFSDAVDATKDAVSTGWLETFEIIFGDYEEAKRFWTDLADEMYDLFAGGKDDRNDILHNAFDSGWTQLIRDGLGDVSDILESGLQEGFSNAGIITDDDIERAGSFQEALGQALRTGKIDADNLEQAIRGAADGYGSLLDKTDSELSKLGYTRREAEKIQKAFGDFVKRIDDGEISIEQFAEQMSQMSGREHFFQGILNILKGISSVISPIREAFNDILMPSGRGLYDVLKSFDQFTQKMTLSKTTAEYLQRAFSGVFAVLKMGVDIVKGIGNALLNTLSIFAPAAKSALKFVASIGDYFVELEKSSHIVGSFEEAFNKARPAIEKVSSAIQGVIGWVAELGAKTSIVFDPLKAIGSLVERFIDFVVPKLEKLASVMSDIFSQLGNSALNGFGSMNSNALLGFANAGLIAGAVAGVKGFFDAFKEIGSGVKDAINGISELLDKLGEAITAWKTNKNAATLKTIATAVAILAGSLVVLSMVDPTRLAAAIGAMISLFTELIVAVAVLTELTKKNKGFGKGTRSMVTMAASVLILSTALQKIGSIDSDKLVSSVAALGAVMAELVVAQAAISKWAKDGAKHAASMLVMAAAVNVLASAVEKLSALEWDEIGRGLVAVGGLLAELAVFSAVSKFGGLSVGKATGILVLAAALAVLQKAVEAFSALSVKELQTGLGAVGALLAEIAVFDMLTSGAEHVVSTAVALTVLSAGLSILAGAVSTIGGMSPEQVGVALGALAVGLLEMGAALSLVKNSIGSAASFLILSVALNAIVPPLKILGGMELGTIGNGLLALGGSMAIMTVAVGALSSMGPIVIGVATALGFLAASLSVLLLVSTATDFIDNLSAGLSSLQTIRLEAFVNTLMTIGMAVGYFVAGLIAGLGKAIGSVATAIAEIIVAVCQALTAAVPAIANTLITVITALCDVLINCLPKIEETLEALIYALCDVLIACTPKILETIDTVLGTIFNYIGSKFGTLGKWIGGKIQSAFNDEHGVDSENGKYVVDGYAKGIEDNADDAVDAVANLAESQDEAFNDYWGIASPAKLAIENAGYIVGGLVEGIQNGTPAAESAMATLARAMDNAFRDEVGIHSNADDGIENGEYYDGGAIEGLENRASDVEDEARDVGRRTGAAYKEGLQEELSNALDDPSLTPQERRQLQLDLRDSGLNAISTKKKADGFDWTSLFGSRGNPNANSSGDTNIDATTSTGKTGGSTKKSSSSSTKQKTAAEQIAETYKTKLEANKTLKDTVDEEYELWQKENQYSANADELLAKKTEHAAAAIQAQSDRVTLAQAKYDELTRKWGADKAETKEAYLDLLQEKTSLADLKAEQYTNLFEEVTKRYDTDLDTLEKEYGLWTAQNDKTATQTDKINRETEYMTAELAIKEKKLAKVQEQYDTLKAQYGETDLRTMEAWNDLLDARTEAQELQNELAQQELDLIDAQLDAIQTAQSRMQSRTDLLAKVFDDGDLSGREDAYKAAVEEYGKDSKEAKKAQLQGTTSSILGVVTALKNMNFQLQQTAEYQKKLAQYTPGTDEYNSAYSNVLSSQSAFLGFAENLADAFNLEDEGKSIVLKLAYAVQKNWDPLSKAMGKAWTKATENIPEEKVKAFTDALGMVFSDEGIEIGTEFTSAIVSALQGDWAGAAVSAITAALDFASTNEGKQLLADVGSFFGKVLEGGLSSALPTLQTGMGQVVTIFGSASTEITGLLAGGGGLAELATGVFGTISGAFSSLIAVLPEILPFLLVGGAILALLGGIAAIVIKRRKEKKDSNDIADAGKDLDKDFADGITDGKGEVDDAIGDMTDHATDIAAAAISTIRRLNGDEYTYTPQIAPVMDLTSVDDSMKALNQTFDNYRLDGTATKRLAAQVDTVAELQNGVQAQSNAELLAAVDALGDRMDAVGENIRGMKFVVDGKTTLGWIDAGLGARAARRAR